MDILTIGRQEIYFSEFDGIKYLDEYLVSLGHYVEILDTSEYEGATITHNLNLPLDEKNRCKFDIVIDGGTIEHIFDIRTCFSNYVNFLRKDGKLFIATPSNNQVGHGFYQFSPEFFFALNRSTEGIRLGSCTIEEHWFLGAELKSGKLYEVSDPQKTNSRVMLRNSMPVTIFVIFHKTVSSKIEIISSTIIQSDYLEKHSGSHSRSSKSMKLRKMLPMKIANIIIGIGQLIYFSKYNRLLFTPIKKRRSKRRRIVP